MDPIAIITGYVAKTLPGYPTEAVAKATEATGGIVLWAGPATTPDRLDEMLRLGVWGLLSLLVAIACFAWVGRFMWRTNGRKIEDSELSRFHVVAITAATFSMIFTLSGLAMIEATRISGEAYLVTTSKVVSVTEDKQIEMPAGAIASISSGEEGITISTVSGPTFKIVPFQGSRADLENALRVTLEHGGKGLRIKSEGAG